MEIFEFIKTHWSAVVVVLLIVANIANAISLHFSDHKGVKKWMLFIVEMISIVTSKNATSIATPARLKLPMQSIPPATPQRYIDNAKEDGHVNNALITVLAIATLLILAALISGCAQNKKQTALKALAITHQIASAGYEITANACKPALKRCIAKKQNPCSDLTLCQEARKPALKSIHSLSVAILLGIHAAKADNIDSLSDAIAAVIKAAKLVCDGVGVWVDANSDKQFLTSACTALKTL